MVSVNLHQMYKFMFSEHPAKLCASLLGGGYPATNGTNGARSEPASPEPTRNGTPENSAAGASEEVLSSRAKGVSLSGDWRESFRVILKIFEGE